MCPSSSFRWMKRQGQLCNPHHITWGTNYLNNTLSLPPLPLVLSKPLRIVHLILASRRCFRGASTCAVLCLLKVSLCFCRCLPCVICITEWTVGRASFAAAQIRKLPPKTAIAVQSSEAARPRISTATVQSQEPLRTHAHILCIHVHIWQWQQLECNSTETPFRGRF